MKSFGYWLVACVVLLTYGCSEKKGTPERQHYLIPFSDSKIYVEEQGIGNALILLHGGHMDHRMWESQVNKFKDSYRVITIDMRGNGMTENGPSDYQNAEAMLEVMKYLGIDKASFVGLSMGGIAAIDFTLAHPDKVDKLVLASSGVIGWTHIYTDFGLLHYNRAMSEAKIKGDTAAYIDNFVKAWTDGSQRTPEQVNPEVRALTSQLVTENVKKGKWQYFPFFTVDPTQMKRLSSIKLPTLLITGDKDMKDVSIISDEMQKLITGSKRLVISDAGQMVNLEQPEKFNEAVLKFLAD